MAFWDDFFNQANQQIPQGAQIGSQGYLRKLMQDSAKSLQDSQHFMDQEDYKREQADKQAAVAEQRKYDEDTQARGKEQETERNKNLFEVKLSALQPDAQAQFKQYGDRGLFSEGVSAIDKFVEEQKKAKTDASKPKGKDDFVREELMKRDPSGKMLMDYYLGQGEFAKQSTTSDANARIIAKDLKKEEVAPAEQKVQDIKDRISRVMSRLDSIGIQKINPFTDQEEAGGLEGQYKTELDSLDKELGIAQNELRSMQQSRNVQVTADSIQAGYQVGMPTEQAPAEAQGGALPTSDLDAQLEEAKRKNEELKRKLGLIK